jgi:hypothetical protein
MVGVGGGAVKSPGEEGRSEVRSRRIVGVLALRL